MMRPNRNTRLAMSQNAWILRGSVVLAGFLGLYIVSKLMWLTEKYMSHKYFPSEKVQKWNNGPCVSELCVRSCQLFMQLSSYDFIWTFFELSYSLTSSPNLVQPNPQHFDSTVKPKLLSYSPWLSSYAYMSANIHSFVTCDGQEYQEYQTQIEKNPKPTVYHTFLIKRNLLLSEQASMAYVCPP